MSSMVDIELDTSILSVLSTEQAWYYRAVPKEVSDNTLSLYVDAKSFSSSSEEELEFFVSKTIVAESLASDVIQGLLSKHYRKSNAETRMVSAKTSDAEGFVLQIIEDARSLGSSDVHIEIYDAFARVRIRIDGNLVERYKIGKADYPEIVNKVKINAKLDITEKRLPQDGRINFRQGGHHFDIRVSVLPTLYGEKIVLRLLGHEAKELELESIGLAGQELANYTEGIKKPNGIILISGPTGSGKTTTLYATLKTLNDSKRNIVTVEDPIEYTLEGINQVQLKESIGLTFASALRSFLRQDPDVIMLGEIRDGETAQMAIRAALTGHLVLSTIHTNSAWGTISRLLDMGVPSFLLANTMNTSVAQRLVKRLCPSCKAKRKFTHEEFPPTFETRDSITTQWVPVGCENCHHTGYSGRIALYEVIPVDQEVAESIRLERFEIDEKLRQRSIRSLAISALDVFKKGDTSLDEVYPLLAR